MERGSVGEELIAEYFDEKGIKYKRQVKISNLKGDYKAMKSTFLKNKKFRY